MNKKVNIVISKDEHGYFASCPALPGCHTQGDTYEEVLTNMHEALDLYLETMTPEEIQESLSQEILNTAIEVNIA